jgi:hypothetical protein
VVKGPFLAYLRWRGIDVNVDLRPCERHLVAEGAMREVVWNHRINHCVSVADADRLGLAMLDADPCAFASRPVVVVLDDSVVAAAPLHDHIATFKLSV